MRRYHFAAMLGCVVLMLTSTRGQGSPGLDWPQWRGPERNGISRETGLAAQWPASGPPVSGRPRTSGPATGRWRSAELVYSCRDFETTRAL